MFVSGAKTGVVVGRCNNTTYLGCLAGTANDPVVADDKDYYRWRCDGLNGGANSVGCFILKSASLAGKCDFTKKNGCLAGTANDPVVADTQTHYRWRCDGVKGGANSGVCSIIKSSVVTGVCDIEVRNGCTTGTARYTADDAADTTVPSDYRDTTLQHKWQCVGAAGGDDSGVCKRWKTLVHRNQVAKLTASDKQNGDNLGYSVAIDGNTAIVGAYSEDTGGSDAGAAYIFTRTGSTWSQQAKLQAGDKQGSDYFGRAVGIDGNTAIVGAYGEDTGGSNAGAAYIFTRTGSTWSQQAKIQAGDKAGSDLFGYAVGIDGNTAIVGAYGENTGGSAAGAAYIFTRTGSTWSQQAKIQAGDKAQNDYFGVAVGYRREHGDCRCPQ